MAARMEHQMEVPVDYLTQFRMAELTFLHQRVFDPRGSKFVFLAPLDNDCLDQQDMERLLHFIGPYVSTSCVWIVNLILS
jgi:hypothetical protein